MRKTIKHFLLAIIFMITLMAMSGNEAQAAANPKFESKKVTTYFYEKTTDLIALKNIKSNAKVTVKSSNPKVAKATFYNYKKSDSVWFDDDNKQIYYGVELNVKKAGSTTITCTINQDGKTYKISCVYKVKKYKNPVSAFKIGTVNCASEFKKTNFSLGSSKLEAEVEELAEQCKETDAYGSRDINIEKFEETLKNTKVKVEITPQKGFKIKKIWLGSGLFSSNKDKKLKNGSKYSWSTLLEYDSIYVEVVDKEGTSIVLEMLLPDEEMYYF